MAGAAFAQVPKAAGGHPDLTGIWQGPGTANWDLEDHRPESGPFYQLGAIGGVPPGRGVVKGNRWKNDPEVKCYIPGIPPATYLPYPSQIVQGTKVILMAYSFESANRVIEMGKPKDPSVDTWTGTANGHRDGDTLVVDNRGFNDLSWFDRPGDYHSDALHVVERYSRTDRDHIRDVEPNATLPEFKCVEMTEELLYRDLNGPGAR